MDDTAHDTPDVPLDDPADSVGPLLHRPGWMVATRVGALAGYTTAVGMASTISTATCTVISWSPFL